MLLTCLFDGECLPYVANLAFRSQNFNYISCACVCHGEQVEHWETQAWVLVSEHMELEGGGLQLHICIGLEAC